MITRESEISLPKPPLQVYVIWRPTGPNAQFCATFADLLYTEICRDAEEPLLRGIGIPTFFRSAVMPGSTVPLPVSLDGAKRVCAILLLDYEAVLDREWIGYVEELRSRMESSPGYHLLLPIALDSEALGFPGLCGENSIRKYEFDIDVERQTMTRILHELCRQLADDVRPKHSPTPVRLFLSHAKLDGRDEAIKLKERIESATNAKPFFDAIDIAIGYKFSEEIEGRIEESVLVAIASDAYSSRPWCRREVLLAKKHERPVIVVDTLKDRDLRRFPYMGNVPVVRWSDNADVVIHAALSESLRFEYARQHLEALKSAGQFSSHAKVMARPPELIDLQRFISAQQGGLQHVVVYPDPPLGVEELETLTSFCGTTQFLTSTMSADSRGFDGKVVGISVADSGDLSHLGLGRTHVRDVTVEVARQLLARGATLAYGGDLRPDGFTWNLLDLVFLYAGGADENRIQNFRAWTVHRFEEVDTRRQMARIQERATFHELPLPADVEADFPDVVSTRPQKDDPVGRYINSRSLGAMRMAMQGKIDARIALGGRVAGYSGKYPGLLEEVDMALQSSAPVYVLGGYGGCAATLACLLRGEDADEFTLAYQSANNIGYAEFVDLYNSKASKHLELGLEPVDYDAKVERMQNGGVQALRNGLSDTENLRLFDSVDPDEISHLLLKGLSTVLFSQ